MPPRAAVPSAADGSGAARRRSAAPSSCLSSERNSRRVYSSRSAVERVSARGCDSQVLEQDRQFEVASRSSRACATAPASAGRRAGSRRPCPSIAAAFATSLSSVPYSFSHFAAVFGPTLSMPGMLSGAVADQREVVDDLLGKHVELGLHAGAIEARVGHRVDERDALVRRAAPCPCRPSRSARPCPARRRCASVPITSSASTPEMRSSGKPMRARRSRAAAGAASADRRASACVSPCIGRTARRGTSCPARRTPPRSVRRFLLQELLEHVEHAEHRAGGLAARVLQRGGSAWKARYK